MSTINSIDIPDALPYPNFYALKECNELKNKYCYIFKKYSLNGVSLVITRKHDYVTIRAADFKGKDINQDLNSMQETINRIVVTMKYINIPKAQFYFSENKLVDIRLSINKFCGPGWLADFFGKQSIPIQEQIGKPIVLTDENLEMLYSAKGDYSHGKFIVKPSAFKFIIRDGDPVPLYGILE